MTTLKPEASNGQGIEWSRGNRDRRCVATKRTGERCRNWAIRGGAVCRYHGGSTEHIKRKARERIEHAQDVVAMRMIGFALDEGVPPHVALAAAKDILDRGGTTTPTTVELGVKAPWEELMEDLTMSVVRTSRADWLRRRRGVPSDRSPTPDTPTLEVVEAEVVPAQESHTRPPRVAVEAAELDDRPEAAAAESATSPVPVPPAPRALSQDEAADAMRASRLRSGPARGRRRSGGAR